MRQEWLNIWMDLAEAARGHSTSSIIPIFHKRGNRGGGVIFSKYGNKQSNNSQSNHTDKQGEDHNSSFQCAKYQGGYSPEDSNLKNYGGDNCREKQNIWLSSIIQINCITTSTIGINGSKQSLFFSMNTRIKSKGEPMTYDCSKKVFQSLGMDLLKYDILRGNSY